jgi:hypothetical protein
MWEAFAKKLNFVADPAMIIVNGFFTLACELAVL